MDIARSEGIPVGKPTGPDDPAIASDTGTGIPSVDNRADPVAVRERPGRRRTLPRPPGRPAPATAPAAGRQPGRNEATRPGPELVRLLPACPARPPDWRWHWAGHVLDGAIPRPFRRDDPWLRRAVALRAALEDCRGEGDRLRSLDRIPEVARAHEFYTGDPPHARWEIEARILAGEPGAAIARRFGVPAGAIDAFGQIFFDVTGRLGSTGYVVHTVIGPAMHAGLDPQRDLDAIWKLYGYFGGPRVLDALIGGAGVGVGGPGPGHGEGPAADPIRSALRMKLAVAAQTLPVDGASARALLRVLAHEDRSRRGPRDDPRSADELMPNIRSALSSLPWRIGHQVNQVRVSHGPESAEVGTDP